MDKSTTDLILLKAKKFFRNNIANNHIKNTEKLKNIDEFQINPFLVKYLAKFLTGNDKPESIAKALVYPRVLGTSITTSFGTHLQAFCTNVLEGFASTAKGIDIEFEDQIDKRKKYCQLKSGPNTLNNDDVATVIGHFKGIRNLARTNNLKLDISDMIVGVLYGTKKELSGSYKKVACEYPVFVGQEFWHRLTGNNGFYFELINALAEVAVDTDSTRLLNSVIDELALQIKQTL